MPLLPSMTSTPNILSRNKSVNSNNMNDNNCLSTPRPDVPPPELPATPPRQSIYSAVTSPLLLELLAQNVVPQSKSPVSGSTQPNITAPSGLLFAQQPTCRFCASVIDVVSKLPSTSYLNGEEGCLGKKMNALDEVTPFFLQTGFNFNSTSSHMPRRATCISNLIAWISPYDVVINNQQSYDKDLEMIVGKFILNLARQKEVNLDIQDDDGNDLIKLAIIHRWSSEFIVDLIEVVMACDTVGSEICLGNKNKNGETTLSLALKNELDQLVVILIALYNVQVTDIDSKRNNLLHYVHKIKTPTLWKQYITLKDIPNSLNIRPLQAVLAGGHAIDDITFRSLIPSRDVINQPNSFGHNLLMTFLKYPQAYDNKAEKWTALVDAGADIGSLMGTSILENSAVSAPGSQAIGEITSVSNEVKCLFDIELPPGSRRDSVLPLPTVVKRSVWDDIPSTSIETANKVMEPSGPKSFASVAAAAEKATPSQATTKRITVIPPKPKIVPVNQPYFCDFKTKLFDEAIYRETFKKAIRGVVDHVSNINSLIKSGKNDGKNRLFSECSLRMRTCQGKAMIEMTKIFIMFKCDFNLQGTGENTNKNCLLTVVKIFESCNWKTDEKEEIIRLMIEDGKAGPNLVDKVGNDALKLAVHLGLPTPIIRVITRNALKTCDELFTSLNNFRQNVIQISQKAKSEETRKYLAKMKIEHDNLQEEKQNLSVNDGTSFNPTPGASVRVPIPVPKGNVKHSSKAKSLLSRCSFSTIFCADSVTNILSQSSDINDMFENTPLFSACLERILSHSLRYQDKPKCDPIKKIFDAAVQMTKDFIRMGVNFDARNYNEMSVLCHTICLSKHYNMFSRDVFYKIVVLILEVGADVTIQDSRGNDALKHALFRKFPICIIEKILDSAGDKEKWLLKCLNKDELNVLAIAKSVEKMHKDSPDYVEFFHHRLNAIESEEQKNRKGDFWVGKDMSDCFSREQRPGSETVTDKENAQLKMKDFIEHSQLTIDEQENELSKSGSSSASLSSGICCATPEPVGGMEILASSVLNGVIANGLGSLFSTTVTRRVVEENQEPPLHDRKPVGIERRASNGSTGTNNSGKAEECTPSFAKALCSTNENRSNLTLPPKIFTERSATMQTLTKQTISKVGGSSNGGLLRPPPGFSAPPPSTTSTLPNDVWNSFSSSYNLWKS